MMFKHFPKNRVSLTDDLAQIYLFHYKANRKGKTPASFLSGITESWLHNQVSKDIKTDRKYKTTLEIGAGTLNHLKWEPGVGPYDIVEPLDDLYKDSDQLDKVRTIYSDIIDIPDCQTYDRIISIATFEHICNLPFVIAKAGLILNPEGQLRVGIPSEGTPLWKLCWKLSTGLEFRIKYNLDYSLLMKHEHVNTAKEIEVLLRYFFIDVSFKVFGLSRSFSIYQFFACKQPHILKCNNLV
jgi:hypothetical protein